MPFSSQDYNKGGVFASLAGTMLLLTEEEKARVKGVIINKFRGDVEILKPGIKMLEDIIKIPVLGVLPYTRLNIEDEDSLAERFDNRKNEVKGEIDVAVVKLPHLSNFTDFNAIENIPGVVVRYVQTPDEMGEPDLIILPGSKNTIEDLVHLRKSKMEAEIKKLHQKGIAVFGVCGGYQMLGTDIEDPHYTESNLLRVDGMGLLNVKTVFQQKKVTTQVEAEVTDTTGLGENFKGEKITGYEIHMGTTDYGSGCIPFIHIHKVLDEDSKSVGGIRNEEGNVFGTYIHGIFDNMGFTVGMINSLRKKKGLEEIRENEVEFKAFKESQYNKLADMIRQNLDMDAVYRIIGA